MQIGGEGRGEEREEERKVGSKVEGGRGSTTLLDPSGVTSNKLECRVEGERVKNKHKKKEKRHQGKRERRENTVYGSEEWGYQGFESCFELRDLIQCLAVILSRIFETWSIPKCLTELKRSVHVFTKNLCIF